MLATLQAQFDAEGDLDWRVSVDSTAARVHQHDAIARRSVNPSGRSASTGLSHTGGDRMARVHAADGRSPVITASAGPAVA